MAWEELNKCFLLESKIKITKNRDTQNSWANLRCLKDQQEGKLEREAILKD